MEVTKMKVQFCKNNSFTNEVVELLKQNHPDYQTEVRQCLGYCNVCEKQAVAKIGDDYFKAEDGPDLFQKIVDHFFRIPSSFIG
jgi:uncharacterized protein YuzB (UPF0349 family)